MMFIHPVFDVTNQYKRLIGHRMSFKVQTIQWHNSSAIGLRSATKVGVVCFMANLKVLMFDELGV